MPEDAMAIGDHWEWRGFGSLTAGVRARIEALPLKFPEPQAITDEYFWLPGVRINVKLRREGAVESLKFKRLIESDGLERWREDAAETHPFPLEPRVLAKLLAELGLEPHEPPAGVPDAAAALLALRRLAPAVARVAVEKKRWQREWAGGGPRGGRGGVIVEIAEVFSPERITSVGIEDEAREAVEAARSALGLPGGLRTLSYLDALGLWARGERIAPGP
jgi:hypothetical protein